MLLWIGFSVAFCILVAVFLGLKHPRREGYEAATITRIDDVVYEDGLRRRIMVQTESGDTKLLQNVLTGRNLHEGDAICVLHLRDALWGYRFAQLALSDKCDTSPQ